MELDFLEKPVKEFVDKNMIAVDSEVTIEDASKSMVNSKADCILTFERGKHVDGIVTEKDLMREVVSQGIDPKNTQVGKIAKRPLLTIDQSSTVKDAIALMSQKDVRRLIVTESGVPIGIITQKRVTGNLGQQGVVMPELENPVKLECPYCFSKFDDKAALSKHIDQIHIGLGLLEGNTKRY